MKTPEERREMAKQAADRMSHKSSGASQGRVDPTLSSAVMPSLKPEQEDIAHRQPHSPSSSDQQSSATASSAAEQQAAAYERKIYQGGRPGEYGGNMDGYPPVKKGVSGVLFAFVVMVMLTASAALFYQLTLLTKQVKTQQQQVAEYEERFQVIGQALSKTGIEIDKSEGALENRIQTLESSLHKLKIASQKVAPAVAENSEQLAALNRQITQHQGGRSEVEKLVKSAEDKVVQQAGALKRIEEQAKASDKEAKRLDKGLQVLQKDAVFMTTQFEALQERVGLLDDTVAKVAGKEGGDTAQAVEALGADVTELQSNLEQYSKSYEQFMQSINLFRRQVNTDLEQIKSEIRQFKNQGSPYDEPLFSPQGSTSQSGNQSQNNFRLPTQ